MNREEALEYLVSVAHSGEATNKVRDAENILLKSINQSPQLSDDVEELIEFTKGTIIKMFELASYAKVTKGAMLQLEEQGIKYLTKLTQHIQAQASEISALRESAIRNYNTVKAIREVVKFGMDGNPDVPELYVNKIKQILEGNNE